MARDPATASGSAAQVERLSPERSAVDSLTQQVGMLDVARRLANQMAGWDGSSRQTDAVELGDLGKRPVTGC